MNVERDGSYKPPTQDMHDENEIIQSQEMPKAQNANVDSQGKVELIKRFGIVPSSPSYYQYL
jgi:hypothetical protein